MSYNILVVDDSSSMRKVVTKIIEMSGFPVNQFHEASNGIEGLECCRQQPVDLIVTDLNMPGMDGLAFLEQLHQDPALQQIPVIVVSTEGRAEIVDEVKHLGVVEFINKPFQAETIAKTMYRMLGVENDVRNDGASETPDF